MGLAWGGNWNTKPCVFPCKVAAGDEERYLLYAAVAAAVDLPFFLCRIVTVVSSCFGCTSACVVIGYFFLCLQIALEWLHDCRYLMLPRV